MAAETRNTRNSRIGFVEVLQRPVSSPSLPDAAEWPTQQTKGSHLTHHRRLLISSGSCLVLVSIC